MSNIPLYIDRALQEIGVLPSTDLEDDVSDVRQGLKMDDDKYNIPLYDQYGDINF